MSADGNKNTVGNEVSIEDFVENGPLFSTFPFKGSFVFPKRLTRLCDKCSRETTWSLVKSDNEYFTANTYYRGGYKCGLCETDSLVIMVVPVKWERVPATPGSPALKESYVPSRYEKIAHYPRPTVKVPATISKALGESSDLYRKALICRNQGFGIAGLAYVRRVVEDKTNELIEVIEKLAVASGVAKEDVARIQKARTERTTFDQKLRLASEAIPHALRPDGVNPIALLYGLVSEGLHGKSEQECLKITDEIRDIFEYVFGQLRARVEDSEQLCRESEEMGWRSEAIHCRTR